MMAFWNRSIDAKDLPESLRDKSPEELAAILAKYGDMEKLVEEEKKKREELEQKQNERQSEFDQMKGKLAELEARTQPQQQSEPAAPEEPPSPWVDPSGFVRNEMKPVADVALMSGMMTARMYFEQNLSQRDRKIFKKFEKDVDQVVGTFAPQARVMPQAFMNAFLYVKGLHEGDIRKAETDNPDSFFSETPSRGPAEEPQPEAKLTPEEEEVCRVFHYDPKSYLETRKQAQLKGSARGMFQTYTVPLKGASNAR